MHIRLPPLQNREMKSYIFWFGILILQQVFGAQERNLLHEYVEHYETLQYDEKDLLQDHLRLRRSNEGPRHLTLSFKAFNKNFDLRLKPDDHYFHKDMKLIVDGQSYQTSTSKSHHYIGHDVNDPTAKVHGSLAFGVFDGAIHTSDETYQIEPASRYSTEIPSHSVIYRQSDMKKNNKHPLDTTCGATTRAQQRRFAGIKYSTEEIDSHQHIKKRQSGTPDKNKVRCWLNAIGDHFFFNGVTDSNDNMDTRIAQATGIIRNIILSGSNTFEMTDFDNDGVDDGITFGLKQLVLNKTDPGNQFSNEFIGVEALLSLHSEYDWDDFCLSYLFTYRDFDDGVLGLAFVAEEGSTGGICDTKRRYTSGYRTLNTGVVTLRNYQSQVSSLVSGITFTHEAGHNFGSEHDPSDRPECVPSGSDGKFLMYAYATDGSRRNNRIFSSCSIEQMSSIISSVGQDSETGCLRYADDKCGNSLLDNGEDCDCGLEYNEVTGICNKDPCCNATSCSLVKGKDCSRQQGQCCTSNCTFIPAADEQICRKDSDCAFNQTCNGTVAYCPEGKAKVPEGNSSAIPCNDGRNYCVEGDCTGSICVPLELPDCQCTTKSFECHVCCQIGNDTCISTIQLAEQNETAKSLLPNGEGNVLAVGYPCNDFEGYCDFYNTCRLVNSEGALQRITAFIDGSGAVQTAFYWITKYWWAGLVGAVAILLVFFFIVLGCHFFLPRPEHMKKRADRRSDIQNKNRALRRERLLSTTSVNPGRNRNITTHQDFEMRRN